MGCKTCKDTTLFKQKLGRCKQCMIQLSILSFVTWAIWFLFFKNNPTSVSSITTLFAASAFSGLLTLHFIVLLKRKSHSRLQK
ncbi:DUF3624 domain-containing protein [Vibrio sp. Of7-15]|uniref:DUF3624 domain-containing protein n=1 Tax=Vibrio sp. Of7-15 TaxID=2724879 RepID=UPI001EF272D8|nr:DUF3624 domain-containing protein [Vibrio sp. Of7-15]MCG7496912.1 DUF3624 domain-containing protein [Vibrio sp. Of7-15]